MMTRTMLAVLVVAAVLTAPVGSPGVSARVRVQDATPGATPVIVDGGSLTRLVPAPPDATTVYAEGDNGFFRSEDAGERWTRVGDPPPDGEIVVAPDDANLLLVGDHPPCARGGGEEPMERSTDGGATWRVTAALGLRPVAITGEGQTAYAVGCAGLYASADGGVSWQPWLEAFGFEITALALRPAATATSAALVVTTSEGGTSRLFQIDLANPDPAELAAQVPLTEFWGLGAPVGQDETLAVATARGVLVSADGGTTWALQRTGLEEVALSFDPTQNPIPEAEQERGFGVNVVAIHPEEPDRLYAGTVDGLFLSEDTGATWAPVAGVVGEVTEVVLLPAAGRLLAGTESGLVVTPI